MDVTRPGLAHHNRGGPDAVRFSHTRQPALDRPGPAEPGPALHLLAGLRVASCPTCGYQLTSARTQERCERRASHRTCPICRPAAAAGVS
jgi:hypothetical protein